MSKLAVSKRAKGAIALRETERKRRVLGVFIGEVSGSGRDEWVEETMAVHQRY